MLVFDLILATRRPVMTGVERYGANLFEAVRRIRPDTVAFVRDASPFRDKTGLIEVASLYGGWFGLPSKIKRRGLSPSAVVFPTAPASPLFLANRVALARIAHDVFPWDRTRTMPLKGRLLFRDVETLMARRYDLFCGTTETVAAELRAQLKRSDIDWCGNAPGLDFSAAEIAPPDAPKEFVLAVGTVEPRKNYARLIKLAESDADGALPIVLVGRSGWGDIVAKIESLAARRPDRFRWYRELADDGALLWLYRRAAGFVSLSHAEGFNMPLVEAAMCGRPVLVSDLPIHRIVAPAWARYVDERMSPAELWEQIRATAAAQPDVTAVEDYRRRYGFEKVADRLCELVDRLPR